MRRGKLVFWGILVIGLSFGLVGLCHSHPLDHWHWRNPLPQGNDLNGVAFGNGIFVAVGSGTILTSSDNGATWTIRDTGLSYWWEEHLTGVVYANGTFVVVGWGGLILTSPDGVNWTKRNSGLLELEDLQGISYGNGIFVAVGGNLANPLGFGVDGTILTSSDNGVTWTERMSDKPYGFTGVAYGNGTFVALCYDPNSKYSKAMTSSDGVTWTERNTGHRWELNGITFGNGIFVAVGINDTPEGSYAEGVIIMTSPDGITWSGRALGVDWLGAVAYGNGTFVAGGYSGDIYTSPNAVTWTSKSPYQYIGPNDSMNWMEWLTGAVYGNGTFVMVGGAGRILTSPDGMTWTRRASGPTSGFSGITYANGTYVVVGGTIHTSSDGVAWTERYDVDYTYLNGIIYANGFLVAVGGGLTKDYKDIGKVATSPNGITWTERTPGTSNRLAGVTYGNGKFVAVGKAGTILTSPDGTSWTNRTSGTSNDLVGVCYGNGLFVAVGWYDTILTSPDGVTWTKRSTGTNVWFSGVTYANGIFVIAGGSKIFTSSDGATWTKRADSYTLSGIQGFTYGNGLFVGVGSYGLIVTSPDGITWTERRSVTNGDLSGVVYGKESFFAVGGYGTILESDPFTTAPGISVDPASVSFGDINQGSSSDRQVTVGNSGNANLVISGVSSPSSPFSKQSDGCSGQSVPPGGSCTVTYRFSPTSAGTFSGNSIITSNDVQKTVNLTGKGIALPAETVSTPSTPTGTGSGKTGSSYSYSTGGSVSSYGHPVQYFLDWGNGTNSGWLPVGTTSASNSWPTAGAFVVKAQAQCANHPDIKSSWSNVLTVTITNYTYMVDTSPSGLQIVVDGVTYTAPQTFYWAANSSHTLSVASPQQPNAWTSEGMWTRYVYSSWSDVQPQSHNVNAPSSNATYTANFTAQYGLITTTNLDEGGTVSPSGLGWYNNGQTVSIQATANSGHQFCQWSGGASGRSNPVSVNMNGPRQVMANFIPTSGMNGWIGSCPAPVSPDWWFMSLHFPTANEGWAVGEDGSNGKGVLFHYLNDAWTEVSPPAWNSTWGLNGVHFVSANEGWAVGEDYANNTGLVMHYANGSWSQPFAPDIGSFWQLNGAHFTSSGSGWAVGDDYGNGGGMLLRYSSGSWSSVDPPEVSSSSWWLNSVYFPSSSEGWAVGEDYENGTGVVFHYTSGTWTNVEDLPEISPDWCLNSVHFTSSTEGWAVGEDYENSRGVLLHYANGTWSEVTPPSVSTEWMLNEVRFVSSSQGWAVGEDYENGNGVLLQYSNGTWTRTVLPDVSTGWRLESVHFVSPNEGWVVGGDYTSVGILIGYKSSPVEKPNLTPYQPPGWSDKIVVSKTKGTNTDSSPITSADTLYVDWAITNNGQTGVSTRFYTDLFVDGLSKKQWQTDPPFNPGQSFSITDFSIGALAAGTHRLKLVTDSTLVIAESNEGDNEYEKVITVGESSGPDLTGEWVSAKQTCTGSGTKQKCKISGSLKVKSIGTKDVTTTSYAEVYLEGEPEDRLVKRLTVGSIKKNWYRGFTISYSLSAGTSAKGKRLYVLIDVDNTIAEINEENNKSFSGEIK